jgi:hypothetical protein
MFTEFWMVVFFYAILSSVIMPLIFCHFRGPSGLGEGYVAGSALSVVLWFIVGKKYAKV